MRIKIDHIARVEGHIGFMANIFKGDVKKARIEVLEGARLIEGLLIGRYYDEAPIITSRICGLCPTIHNITSIKAMEAALDIKPNKPTRDLRKILLWSQVIQSHALHFFFLSTGDFLGIKNNLELIKKHPKLTHQAILVRDFANRLIEIIAGRAIHPLTPCIGGFRKAPNQIELLKLMKTYSRVFKAIVDLMEFFSKLDYTDFERKTEYIGLSKKGEYTIYDGDIKTTDKKLIPEEIFIKNIAEIQKPYEVVKRAEYNGEPFMVGALARLNLQYDLLNPKAKALLKKSKMPLPSYNSIRNVFAQVVETVHALEEIKKLIQTDFSRINLNPRVYLKAGYGVGAAEAPRGTLYHAYQIDKKGIIRNANVITPTAQFLANLEEDLKVLLKGTHNKEKIKMLIRAYDPCISCATH